ncbi:MAG: LytTR family DNA-binding domain-containing protein [Lachnospiraceae bacterium]|nr:LytTR family transcriptional regulator DNA-binding domain-containing protein [Lachnospiraceae bacterium]MDY3817984.1 LytTR family DNA-binding domain-containing protein [Lachnospiraceae bacterium]
MRYTINQIREGEDELILNYRQLNPEVEKVIAFMDQNQKKMIGRVDGETILFSPEEILYIEKVDGRTFAYTVDRVVQVDLSLSTAELILEDVSFFRCSKSMIVNVNKVEKLKSLPSNRIDATMKGGEHIMISRTYASEFRRLLKGE